MGIPLYSTYSAAIVGLAPASSPVDFFTITGSATATVLVTKMTLTANQSTAGAKDLLIVKRSTANSAGTSTSLTVVPYSSYNPTATAVIRAYTANPTLGTLIGNVQAIKTTIPGGANTVLIDFEWEHPFSQGIMLYGTSQVLALNGNGASFGNGVSLDISVEWIEY